MLLHKKHIIGKKKMSDVFIIAPKLDDDDTLPEGNDSYDERFFISEFEARKALEASFQPWMRDKYEIYQATLTITNVFGKKAPEIDIASIMSPPEETEEAPQRSWEEEFVERHTTNPSMNPADYYFQQGHDAQQGLDFFTIVPAEWYDKTGSAWDDNDSVPPNILPPGFEELAESEYEYNGNTGRGKLTLISNGFVEKKMF